MSGLEVAGLAFGIVPIFFEILKSYGWASKKLDSFRAYHEVIEDLQLDFRLEEHAFRSECQILLASVVDDKEELLSVLQHPDDASWGRRDLKSVDDRLRVLVGDDYAICEEVVVKIRDMLRATLKDLAELGRVSETAGGALHNVRDAFKVTVKESRYKKCLQGLNIWNAKFRAFRKQKCALHNPRHFSSQTITSRRVPPKYSKIREASKTLHGSLEDAWSCSNASHQAHQAKLLLHAKEEFGKVRLDMAISCRRKDNQISQKVSDFPIWLDVQSVTTKAQSLDYSTPLTAGLSSSLNSSLVSPPLPPETASLRTTIKRKLKRVRFDDDAGDEAAQPSTPKGVRTDEPAPDVNGQCHSMMNLRDTKSFCCHLNQSQADCRAVCLGFLESRNDFRFIFYDAGKKATMQQGRQRNDKEIIQLNTKIGILPKLERLMLAHKLASTVLQYYLTPWLLEDWRLQDISYFGHSTGTSTEDLVRDMETLHLSTAFPKNNSNPNASATGDEGSARAVKPLYRYTYGIRNMTLAKLGLALLEIGHKKDINSFNLGSWQHDVISARILADGSYTDLGPRYQRIVRKCIECNFSAEDDLDAEDLRNSVYTNVICELESLITAHKRLLDAIQ